VMRVANEHIVGHRVKNHGKREEAVCFFGTPRIRFALRKLSG
jgi:hypothetical protein